MRRLAWVSGAVLGINLTLASLSYAGEVLLNALEFEKTVGTSPTGCPAASQIVVDKGTKVYYCYKVTNHATFTLTTHTLVDSILDNIPLPGTPAGTFNLAPGQTFAISGYPPAGVTINANTMNVATWTAEGTPETISHTSTAPFAADTVTVNATNQAEVVIGAKPAPALGDAALAFVAAAMLLFGAIRLSRKLRDQA